MAIPFLNHIDLTKSEIRNVSLHQTTSTAVGNEKFEGQIIYDTGTDSLKYYNGADWINLDGSGDISKIDITAGDGLSGSVTTTAGDHTQTIDLDPNLTTVSSIYKNNLAIGSSSSSNITFYSTQAEDYIDFNIGGSASSDFQMKDNLFQPSSNNTKSLGTSGLRFKELYVKQKVYSEKYYGSDDVYYLNPSGSNSYQRYGIKVTTQSSRNTSAVGGGSGGQFRVKDGLGAWAGNTSMNGQHEGIAALTLEKKVVVSGVDKKTMTALLLKNTMFGTGTDNQKVLFAIARNNQEASTNAWSEGNGSPSYVFNVRGSGDVYTGIWNGSTYVANSGNLFVNNNLDVTGNATIDGNLVVTGTTTTENVEVVSTSNGVIFEGSAADAHEGTLLAGTLTADRTYTLPDKSGTVAMVADNTFRTIKVDTNDDGTANETIGSSEDLELVGGSNITLAEAGGVVTINAGASTTVGLTNATQRSGSIELIAGGNVGIVEDGTTGHYTFSASNDNTQLATASALIDVSAMGSNTVASFTHSLSSKNLIVQLYQVTTGNVVFADIDHTSTDAISITFANTPTEDIRVVVIDAKNGLSDKTVSYS